MRKLFSHYYLGVVLDITLLIVGLWGDLNDPGWGIGWRMYHGAPGRSVVVNYQQDTETFQHFDNCPGHTAA